METSCIVVMGVSGCGKSTISEILAARLGWDFAEADRFHSERNIEKMKSAIPLTDADREPWLEAIADWISARREEGRCCVVACSALKRAYRERLSRGHGGVRFVHLVGTYDAIAARMSDRTGHYMPLTLLKSQFDTLEPPGDDERPVRIPIDAEPEEIVARIVAEIMGTLPNFGSK